MAADLFRKVFGCEPTVVASAPGRVNLIGDHTDYNGGDVLPIGIAQRTSVAVSRALPGASTQAVSADQPERCQFDIERPTRSGQWCDYVAGMAATMRAAGIVVPQMMIAVTSDVPSGAGLSSSAALEVACGRVFAAIAGSPILGRAVAEMANRAENDFVGVASGAMDQFASALAAEGQALYIQCATYETEHVPFEGDVLIFDTGFPRSLRASPFNSRRRECEKALESLRLTDPTLRHLADATPDQVLAAGLPRVLEFRALHVIRETGRVRSAVRSLRATGQLPGELLIESHESLRDLFACSSPELDWVVEHLLREPGITGARLTGAGWGGCAIAIGERPALASAAKSVASVYKEAFGRQPRTWITRARGGASAGGEAVRG